MISNQQMIFRKHLKIYFLEPFKICLKQKWTITLAMIVMKDLVSLIIVMEQSLKLFVVNMENSKWMYLRIARVPLSLRCFQNARKTSLQSMTRSFPCMQKGMTTRQISETIEDIYGFEISEGMVSDITDKLLPRIEEWQNRPLSAVYSIVFIDAVHFSVRDDGVIRKLAAYVVLGINEDGMKEVLSIIIGENESSKYWLSVLNSLKNRGVQDILILCSDGLTGIKDAISTAFPKTEQQRCIVHMVRNTLKYVANKDMKAFAKDLKTIYTAADEEAARKQLKTVTEKWSGQYPSAMNRWHDNWDAISPIFKFSKEVRTAFYTTNAIESLNSCYRRLNKQRSVFPSSQALLKALYLGTFEIAKKMDNANP